MAASKIQGLTIAINGDASDLNSVLSGSAAKSKTLQSELREVEKLLKLDPTNTELLAQKQTILAQSVETARERLAALKSTYENAAGALADGKISDEQYRALEREVVKAEQALNKLEGQSNETVGAQQKLEASTKEVGEEMADAGQKTSSFGDVFKGAFSANVVSNLVGAAVNKLKQFAAEVMSTADELMRLSSVTHINTEELQKLQYIGDDVGVSLDTISSAQKKLTRAMSDASEGSGKAYEMFNTLGVSVKNADGSLRDASTVMFDTFDALQKVGNETERDAMAMQLFGKSATELNPLIEAGANELNRLGNEAERSGAVMSERAVAGLDAFGDSVDHVKQSIKAFIGEAMATLLDAVLQTETAAQKLGQAMDDFEYSVEKSNDAYEENSKSIEAQAALTDRYIDRLNELESQGLTTAESQREYEGIIANLNSMYPDLNAKIDTNTGLLEAGVIKIDNYTQAWRDAAVEQAKQNYLTEIIQDNVTATIELEKAQNALIGVKAQLDVMPRPFEELATAAGISDEQIDNVTLKLLKLIELALKGASYLGLGDFTFALQSLSEGYVGLINQQDALNKEIEIGTDIVEDGKAALDETTEALGGLGDELEDVGGSTGDTAEEAANYTEKLSELTKTTSELSGATDKLTSALEEQESAGALSLGTINDLTAAGYALALQTDAETGKVTLNKEAYIALATAKIEEQITSAKADRAALIKNLEAEALAATGGATAYIDLAKAKYAELAANNGSLAAYDAQIAALETLRNGLGKTTASVQSYGGSSKKAAETAEDAAKKAASNSLAAYQNQKKELDHLKNMDVIDEAEYYKQLAEIRDEYLSDDGNIDEYRKATEQIHSYDEKMLSNSQKMLDDSLDSYEAYLDGVSNAFEDALADVESKIKGVEQQQSAMAGRLEDYGDLFSWTKDDDKNVVFEMGNLQEQIDGLNQYEDTLSRLKDAGVSDGLMSEISTMKIDDAIAYGEQLLQMGEEDIEAYVSLWEEKQTRAKEIAEKYYQDQLDTLKTEYGDKLGEALTVLQGTAFTSGEDTAKNLIDGATGLSTELAESYAEMARSAVSAYGAAFAQEAAKYNFSLANLESTGTIGSIKAAETHTAAMNTQTDNLVGAITSLVEGLNLSMPNAGAANFSFNVNGTEFARATIDDYRALENSSPQVR